LPAVTHGQAERPLTWARAGQRQAAGYRQPDCAATPIPGIQWRS